MDGFMTIYTKRLLHVPNRFTPLFKGYDGLGVSHRERQIEERHEQNFENLANFLLLEEQCCG
jgi:hypothetical protein